MMIILSTYINICFTLQKGKSWRGNSIMLAENIYILCCVIIIFRKKHRDLGKFWVFCFVLFFPHFVGMTLIITIICRFL
ncbi:hypothetical protein J3Q64DRAFT_1726899, partial [Phycomyces blakesleeanus]